MADCCERYMAGVDPERLLTEADQEIERLEETHQNSLKQADADCQKLKAERDEARAQLREEQDENHPCRRGDHRTVNPLICAGRG